jgi:hypothetical protein
MTSLVKNVKKIGALILQEQPYIVALKNNKGTLPSLIYTNLYYFKMEALVLILILSLVIR